MNEGVFHHLLNMLTLVGMVKGLRFCMRESSLQHRAVSRQYWNLSMKMGKMVGVAICWTPMM